MTHPKGYTGPRPDAVKWRLIGIEETDVAGLLEQMHIAGEAYMRIVRRDTAPRRVAANEQETPAP